MNREDKEAEEALRRKNQEMRGQMRVETSVAPDSGDLGLSGDDVVMVSTSPPIGEFGVDLGRVSEGSDDEIPAGDGDDFGSVDLFADRDGGLMGVFSDLEQAERVRAVLDGANIDYSCVRMGPALLNELVYDDEEGDLKVYNVNDRLTDIYPVKPSDKSTAAHPTIPSK